MSLFYFAKDIIPYQRGNISYEIFPRLFRLFDYLKWNFKCQAAEYLGYKVSAK